MAEALVLVGDLVAELRSVEELEAVAMVVQIEGVEASVEDLEEDKIANPIYKEQILMKGLNGRLPKKQLKIEKIKRKWKIFDTTDWPKYVVIDKHNIEYKKDGEKN